MKTMYLGELIDCVLAADVAQWKINPKQCRKRREVFSDTLRKACEEVAEEREIEPEFFTHVLYTRNVNLGTKKWTDIRKLTQYEKIEKITNKSVLTYHRGEQHRVSLYDVDIWVIGEEVKRDVTKILE